MKRTLALLLLILPGTLAAQSAKRCLLDLAAMNNLRRVEQFGNNVTVYLGGHVRFQCQGQKVFLESDSVQIVNENMYLFMGHALYRDTSMTVSADTLTYFKHATNPAQDETILARKSVKVTDLKTGSTLNAPSVDFMRGVKGVRDSDDVQASGRPVVRYIPLAAAKNVAQTKPWTITADHLRGFGQSRLWGGGTVVVDRDSLHIEADSLDVLSGKTRAFLFLGKPATLRRIGPDSFLIKGKHVRLAFQGDSLRAVRAFGSGEVIRGSGTINGDSILIAYEKDKVTRTDVWGKGERSRVLSNGYHASGDSLVIETPDEKLRALRTFGNGELISPLDTLHPLVISDAEGGPPGPDTLWGNRLFATFDDRDSSGTIVNRISLIRAFGSARSYYSYNAGDQGQNCPTLTYSRADTIIVRMKSGDSTGIADVKYHGHVDVITLDKTTATKAKADTVKTVNPCRGTKR